MARLAALAGLVFALALWAAPALAQQRLHSMGGSALSQDGERLAFHMQGMPANTFLVVEIGSGRSLRFELPPVHEEMRDLVWAQASNTLLFVSRVGDGSTYSAKSILTGHGTHVWAVDFTSGDPQPAKVVARGPGFRWPALSADGTKLAYFQPVPLPREEPPNAIAWPAAYGVFESDIATGVALRVARSQYGLPRALYYDGDDAWLFSADHPQYAHTEGRVEFWSSARPGAPPAMGTFDQLTTGIKSFRMERGEVLPGYPDFKKPWPPMGVAPLQAGLVGVTLDGRPILFGVPGAENTAANQQRNSMSWYIDGVSRVPMQYGYVAFGPQGEREVYIPPDFAVGYNGNTGGLGVDGALKRSFRIDMAIDTSKPDAGQSSARVFVYDGQTLVLGLDVSDIIARAETVRIVE